MKKHLFQIIHIHRKGEYRWISSSLAFYLFVSFVPILFATLFISIRFLDIDPQILTQLVEVDQLDQLLQSIVVNINQNISNVSLILVGALMLYSLYIASNGVNAVMYAINSFFGFKKPPFLRGRILSLIVTALILISVLILLLAVTFLPMLLSFLHIDQRLFVPSLLIFPFLYLIIHMVFFFLTNFQLRAKQIYKGALFSTVAIALVLLLSSWIFQGSTTNTMIYGSLIVILLIGHFFLYLGYCIYFGIAINVASYQVEQGESHSLTDLLTEGKKSDES